VDYESSDGGEADDVVDRKRRTELVATRFRLVAEQRGQQRVAHEAGSDQVHAYGRDVKAEFFVMAARASSHRGD
jgi:hypothetical protein